MAVGMRRKGFLVDLAHYALMFVLFVAYNRIEQSRGGPLALLFIVPALLATGISWRIAYRKILGR
jgi:hypothetical protein